MRKVTHLLRFLLSMLMLWAVMPYANAQASAVCYPHLVGLTGWWPGNGSPNDVIGGRDALLQDDARTGPGLIEQAFALDGEGDYVEVPHDPALNPGTGDFAVAFWVNFTDTAGEQVLVEKYIEDLSEAPPGWTFTKLDDNRLRFGTGPGPLVVDSLPLTLPSNSWIHLAAQRSAGVGTIFMNGVPVAAGPLDYNADATASLKFGHRGSPADTPGSADESGFFLNGRIDEVQLFIGRALAESAIRAIYDAGGLGQCAAIVPTPAPSPPPPVVELLYPQLKGVFIELQAQPLRPDLWTRIQWQDAFGGWHDIEGWQGAFNPDHRVLWYVGEEHLGDGPFRWLVYENEWGDLLAVSQPFDLPSRGGEVLHVEVTLADHSEDGELTSSGVEIPQVTENIALGKPVVVVTNGADDDREDPGIRPADITDGRLDYLPAGDAQEDGVVGYVNDDFDQRMVITVTIDLQGTYDISQIRYNMGDVQRSDAWNADVMTTVFGSTSTIPGTPGLGVWTEHTGRATVSSVTITLEKTRILFENDWLFIGEIEVYGVPSEHFLVYESDFDDLTPGHTRPFPGSAGHDGWHRALAYAPGYGEIQNETAVFGQALHEFTSSAVEGLFQTIDKRLITPPDLEQYPLITLQVDFFAHTSNLDARNVYDAFMAVNGGPHPGYEIVGFFLTSGNGVPRGETGVNVTLHGYNGTDNNIPFTPGVGQQLAWDRWHHVTLVVDQVQDRYVSLTVNGQTEALSAYALPRSELDGVWNRGQRMEAIIANIAPHVEFGDTSEDDVYWDNLLILVGPAG